MIYLKRWLPESILPEEVTRLTATPQADHESLDVMAFYFIVS